MVMPQLDQLPISVRYLKARLRILKRPDVWGSTALMLLVLLGFAEYWQQSEQANGLNQERQTGAASLEELPRAGTTAIPSEADSAIAADIDTLPLLLDEFDFSADATPSLPPTATPDEAADRSLPTLSATTPLTTRSPQSAGTDSLLPATPTNAFRDLNLPNVDLLPGVTSGLSIGEQSPTRTASIEQSTPATTTSLINPLQTAIQRLGIQPEAVVDPQPIDSNQTSTTPQLPGALAEIASPLPPLVRPNGVQPGGLSSPPLGSTGYTLPPSLRSAPAQPAQPNRSYADSFNTQPIQIAPQLVPPTIPLQPQPSGQYAIPSYGTGQGATSPSYSIDRSPIETLQPAPAPFSVPNTVPGRYIGNGEFNTFSNP